MNSVIQLAQTNTGFEVELPWARGGAFLEASLIGELDRVLEEIEDGGPVSVVTFSGLATSRRGTVVPGVPELDLCRKWEALIDRLERLPAMSVAAIDGNCVDAAFQLALACDYRVATRRSRFRLLGVKQGFLPGMSTFRLAKNVGLGVARRLILTGETMGAAQAMAVGLLDRDCEPGELENAVAEINEEHSGLDGKVVRLARRLLNESFSTSFEDAIGNYLAAQSHCLSRLEGGTDD